MMSIKFAGRALQRSLVREGGLFARKAILNHNTTPKEYLILYALQECIRFYNNLNYLCIYAEKHSSTET